MTKTGSQHNEYPLNALDLHAFNRVLRHRIRNFCAGVKMTIERIGDRAAQVDPQISERCSLVISELSHLQTFTDKMELLFDDLPACQEVPLFQLIVKARELFVHAFPTTSFELVGPEAAMTLPHGSWLLLALTELATNAGEAAGFDGAVEFIWRVEPVVQFCIVNDGDPIPESIPTEPPTPFFSERSRHNGLGLAIAYRLCLAMNASLSFQTMENGRTAASITCAAEEVQRG